VILDLEVELPWRAPPANFDVVRFVAANGHAFVRQVRHFQQQPLQARLNAVERRGRCLHCVAERAHFRHDRRRVFAAPLHRPDLLRQCVAPRLQLFCAGLNGATFGFERRKRRDVERVAACGKARGDAFDIFAQQLDVEHGESRMS